MFNPACRALKIDHALHRSSASNQQRFFRLLPYRNDGKSTAHCREKREQENHARAPSRSAALMSSCMHPLSQRPPDRHLLDTYGETVLLPPPPLLSASFPGCRVSSTGIAVTALAMARGLPLPH